MDRLVDIYHRITSLEGSRAVYMLALEIATRLDYTRDMVYWQGLLDDMKRTVDIGKNNSYVEKMRKENEEISHEFSVAVSDLRKRNTDLEEENEELKKENTRLRKMIG